MTPAKTREYRYVGSHADELEGGRPIAPGEYTGPINISEGKNAQMADDGLLIQVEDGTTAAVAAIDEATTEKGDHLTHEEWQAAARSSAKKKDGD